MWQYIIKIALSAIVLVTVAELAKRNPLWAATLASLPIASILTFIWIYLDSGDASKISALSEGILWLVIPSLLFFITLPLLLRNGFGFWVSLGSDCVITGLAYFGMIKLLGWMGVKI